jgi:hypothetical protein
MEFAIHYVTAVSPLPSKWLPIPEDPAKTLPNAFPTETSGFGAPWTDAKNNAEAIKVKCLH